MGYQAPGALWVVALAFLVAGALAGIDLPNENSLAPFDVCSPFSHDIGSFTVAWQPAEGCAKRSPDRLALRLHKIGLGGHVAVWPQGQSSRPVLSTETTVRQQGHFLAAERLGVYFKQDGGGNFELVRGRALASCSEQTVDSIAPTEDNKAVLLKGQLRCTGRSESPSVSYVITFTQLSSSRLGYEVTLQGSPGGEAGCLDPAQSGGPRDGDCPALILSYDSSPDEAFYGFGAQYTVLNHKGYTVPVMTREQGVGRGRQPLSFIINFMGHNKGAAGDTHSTYTSIPAYVTSHRRGMYVTSPEYMEFNLEERDVSSLLIHSTSLTGAILSASDALGLVSALTEYTGRPIVPPEWSTSGLVLGITGGTDRVLASLERLKTFEHHDALAAVWMQDWSGLRTFTDFPRQGLWWNWELDATHYHSWGTLRKAFEDMGAKTLLYINPMVATNITARGTPFNRDLFAEARKAGYLVKDPTTGQPWVGYQDNALVDLTNPDAVQWYKQVIQKEMLGIGASGWMSDFGENLPLATTLASGQRGYEVHSQYPLMWQELNRAALSENRMDGDAMFFSRSASLKSPGVMSHLWLGDQLTTFDDKDGLASAVTGLLSTGLTGIPFVHSDIGGYTAIDLHNIVGLLVNERRSKELFLRWCEFSAFSMMYRLHPGTLVSANWQFDSDDETTRHTLRFAKVFRAWAEYRNALAQRAHLTGEPVFRPMFVNYYDDAEMHGANLRHQYMIGDELLVAPTVSKGASHTKVHFPRGDVWVSVWESNIVYSGGQVQSVHTPIGSPAVFHKQGSVIGEGIAKNIRSIA